MNTSFDALFEAYPCFDYVIWSYFRSENHSLGWYRYRCYHDGAWLEGYDVQPVIYWGA